MTWPSLRHEIAWFVNSITNEAGIPFAEKAKLQQMKMVIQAGATIERLLQDQRLVGHEKEVEELYAKAVKTCSPATILAFEVWLAKQEK